MTSSQTPLDCNISYALCEQNETKDDASNHSKVLWQPNVERIIEATYLSTICTIAILGNVSLWLIITRDKSLRSTSNALILLLSSADLCVSSLNMPVTVVTILAGDWILGRTACIVIGYITMTTFVTSVMSLGVISANRFVLICYPSAFRDVYTVRNTALMISGTVLVSALISSPPLFGWSEYGYLPGQSFCFCQWTTSVSYTFFMVGVCFGGPCTSMTFCYARILKTVRDSKRRVTAGGAKANTSKVNRPPEQGQKQAPNQSKRQEDFKLATSFLVVVVGFIICWGPFCCTMFWNVLGSTKVPRILDMCTLLLGCTNSAANPIIYGILNKKFRRGYKMLWCGRCIKDISE